MPGTISTLIGMDFPSCKLVLDSNVTIRLIKNPSNRSNGRIGTLFTIISDIMLES